MNRLTQLVVFAVAPWFLAAAAPEPTEATLKARHLLGFAEFVEWPDGTISEPATPLAIGVIGDDRVLEELGRQRVRRVAGRTVSVRGFTWEELTDPRGRVDASLRACQVLFIGRSESRTLPLVARKLQGASVLTVGDGVSFARRGGVIGFFRVPGELLIEVNLEAARQARLKISSQLLRLVKVIQPEVAQPRASR